jgi:hypothetical protein
VSSLRRCRLMGYRTTVGLLKQFITQQEEIAGRWNGDEPGQAEDDAHTALDLIELTKPLLDQLEELIADEDFVRPAK